ncbi:hypothetical protein ACHQM5_003919 [Ranunculus cassubicifolius]
MESKLELPVVDLCCSDRASTAKYIRQACVDSGFFYLVNHGVEEDLLQKVFDESKKFFSLPMHKKMSLERKEQRGYSPVYAEKLDSSLSRGDLKESFYIGPTEDLSQSILNQWPSEELLPSWRPTMISYYQKIMSAGKRLISLIALALNLDEDFFVKIGALDKPMGFIRLLHYPGEPDALNDEYLGASPHSDYGMITLLATDSVRGLQICREKDTEPRIWEDVHHMDGAFVVNIGDMLERWTNCLFRSTMHRVLSTEQERYSVAFFLDPNYDCVVECLKSCCSEVTPPRFPPVRSGDYLQERFRVTYGS